jgi:hypothetical protein
MRILLEVEIDFSPAYLKTKPIEAARNIQCQLDDTFGVVLKEKVVSVRKVRAKKHG